MTTYYDGPDLETTVLDALRTAGRDPEAIDSDDLAGMDEFHAQGRACTIALARLADVEPGERLIDVGAGIGGPARTLARHFGARVTAVEPTERFVRLAGSLTERAGLADRVTVARGDGRALPFADGSFDVAWTQAVWQSVEDKSALAAEIRRVLVPGGRLAMAELFGSGEPLHFPVPWGDGPADSHVLTEADLKAVVREAGFEVEQWLTTADALPAVAAATTDGELMSTGVPGVGLELLMPDYEERMAGVARNIGEGRIGLLLATLRVGGSR
jgi:ubiquinone/menaquinone biosynthesis C-methylase UbiE